MTENEKVYKSDFSIVCFVIFSLLQKGHGWDLLVRMKVPCLSSGVSPLEFVLSLFFLLFFHFSYACRSTIAQFLDENKNIYSSGYTVN